MDLEQIIADGMGIRILTDNAPDSCTGAPTFQFELGGVEYSALVSERGGIWTLYLPLYADELSAPQWWDSTCQLAQTLFDKFSAILVEVERDDLRGVFFGLYSPELNSESAVGSFDRFVRGETSAPPKMSGERYEKLCRLQLT